MTARLLSRANLIRGGAGLVVGFGSGFAVARLANAVGLKKAQMRLSDDLALMSGTILLAAAAFFLLLSFDRQRLARSIECDPELPASDEEAAQARLQAAVLGLAGVLMPLPVLAGPAAKADPSVGLWTLAACLGLLALQSWLNLRLWRRSDEVLRDLTVKGAAVSFWIGQLVLYGLAAASRLAGAPAPDVFDLLVGALLLYLVASAVISIRLRPRA